jgi:hypothetical protein
MVHAQLRNVFGIPRSLCSKNTQRCVEVCILQSVLQTHIVFSQVRDARFALPVCNIVRFDGRTRNNTPLMIQRGEHLGEVLMHVNSIRARGLLGIKITMTRSASLLDRCSEEKVRGSWEDGPPDWNDEAGLESDAAVTRLITRIRNCILGSSQIVSS